MRRLSAFSSGSAGQTTRASPTARTAAARPCGLAAAPVAPRDSKLYGKINGVAEGMGPSGFANNINEINGLFDPSSRV
jgi:hypothetical protein